MSGLSGSCGEGMSGAGAHLSFCLFNEANLRRGRAEIKVSRFQLMFRVRIYRLLQMFIAIMFDESTVTAVLKLGLRRVGGGAY